MKQLTIGLLIILLLAPVACSGDSSQPTATSAPAASPVSSYAYQVPMQTDDGWQTASLQDVGMDPVPLQRLMSDLWQRDDHRYHAILIAKDGTLVLEEYFPGQDADLTAYEFDLGAPMRFDRDTLHFQASATKSVTSLLLGIAIDKGFVQGVDDPMLSYFPGYSDLGLSDDITLAHMLAMATGLDWSEDLPYTDPRNPLTRMWHSRDPVRVALEQPVVAPPGAHFIYNSGTTNLLAEVVRRASGQPLREFADRTFFSPLGISSYEWIGFKHDPEMALASSALYLRPRDMAKIGQLMLQEGAWEGRQIVSAEWVRESVRKVMDIPADMQRPFHADGYGYQWWLESYRSGRIRAYSARGHGMQFIVVLPDVDMVVVFAGGAWRMSPFAAPVQFHEVIEDVILPSIR